MNPLSPGLATTYLYKIYDPVGVYLGPLRNVTSDFKTTYNINTAGTSISIDVAALFDYAALSPGYFNDPQAKQTVGGGPNNTLIKSGNGIIVIEYSQWNPNGVVAFNGYISQFKISTKTNLVSVSCLSIGTELDQYVFKPFDSYDYQYNYNTTIGVYGGLNGYHVSQIQSTNMSTDGTGNASAIAFRIGLQNSSVANTVTVAMVEYDGSGSVNQVFDSTKFVRSASVTIPAGASTTDYTFRWTYPYYYVAGKAYAYTIYTSGDSGSGITVAYATNVSSAGLVSGIGTSNSTNTGYALYSQLYRDNNTIIDTTITPGNMVRDSLESYKRQGGKAFTYNSTTVPGSNEYSVSYKLSQNTILETLNTAQKAAVAGTYWYATMDGLINFMPAPTVVSHTFIRGVHISDLEITETIEDVKNDVYFTGGDPGTGSNLVVRRTNTVALTSQRRGLSRIQDGRVTVTSSAILLATAELGRNTAPLHVTTIDIFMSTYNTSLIQVGQLIQFRGWGNAMIDALQLQVVGITRQQWGVSLTLDKIRARETETVESLRRQLAQSQQV